MKAIIHPSTLNGSLVAPASKSAMQRACAAALIKGGITHIKNPGSSEDDKAAIEIIRSLGATVNEKDGELVIISQGINPIKNNFDCGESGLSLRLFTPIASVSEKEILITGKGSLLKRPIDFFDKVLPELNVSCESNHGLLPIKIQGPVRPGNIEIDGSLSSQFLTGLLFSYAAAGASDVTITVHGLNSKPYIDLSLQVMADFGLKVPINKDYREFYFPILSVASFENQDLQYSVEADWSSASFLLVAATIAGDLTLKGLDVFSKQADKKILEALSQSRAHISIETEQVQVKKNRLIPFHFDATDCPDLFPPLVALACYCDGSSVIEGVHRLLHKESNRAVSLQEEFGKMGIEIRIQDDLMIIKGGKVNGTQVRAHHDHRIAMACAVAALGAEDVVNIEEAESVNKSYPQFWTDLEKIGVNLSLVNNP